MQAPPVRTLLSLPPEKGGMRKEEENRRNTARLPDSPPRSPRSGCTASGSPDYDSTYS